MLTLSRKHHLPRHSLQTVVHGPRSPDTWLKKSTLSDVRVHHPPLLNANGHVCLLFAGNCRGASLPSFTTWTSFFISGPIVFSFFFLNFSQSRGREGWLRPRPAHTPSARARSSAPARGRRRLRGSYCSCAGAGALAGVGGRGRPSVQPPGAGGRRAGSEGVTLTDVFAALL